MATKRKSKTIRIPLMPLRGLMIFPHMVLHFDVGRPRSIAALDHGDICLESDEASGTAFIVTLPEDAK